MRRREDVVDRLIRCGGMNVEMNTYTVYRSRNWECGVGNTTIVVIMLLLISGGDVVVVGSYLYEYSTSYVVLFARFT